MYRLVDDVSTLSPLPPPPAQMIFLEGPAGVGFSKNQDLAAGTGDAQTALDNYNVCRGLGVVGGGWGSWLAFVRLLLLLLLLLMLFALIVL